MSAILSIVNYNLKSLKRNFKSAGIMFILPIVFMFVFALAFGGNGSTISFSMGLLEQYNDSGTSDPDINYKEIFEDISKNTEDINIQISIYQEEEKLKKAVENDNLDIGLITSYNTTLRKYNYEFIGESTDLMFVQSKAILTETLTSIAASNAIELQTKLVDLKQGQENEGSASGFTILAPGLIIYGILILLPGIAQSFTEITEKKYIFRLANSKIKSLEIILGNVLYYTIIGTIQVFLLYFTAQLFGYRPDGNILIALIPALLSLFFVIGLGLLIGSFTQKVEAATNIGTIISIIFGFFSGSFIAGIGNVLEFELFGRLFQFNDFLPTKWGTDAIEKILTDNLFITDIILEITILLISGIVTLIFGVYVYSMKQLHVHK